MRVSRRVFLGCSLGCSAAAPALAIGDLPARGGEVMDLGCVLPESLAGFKTQVRELRSDVLIVPAVRVLSAEGRRIIQSRLERGATVLLEYGAGERVQQSQYFPYVEYYWPVRVKIREFSPVKLTPAPGEEIIATFAGAPVGLRRRAGNGMLITLGSPLGPVFLTGDQDARRWLEVAEQPPTPLKTARGDVRPDAETSLGAAD
jgi:hypothetical protein